MGTRTALVFSTVLIWLGCTGETEPQAPDPSVETPAPPVETPDPPPASGPVTKRSPLAPPLPKGMTEEEYEKLRKEILEGKKPFPKWHLVDKAGNPVDPKPAPEANIPCDNGIWNKLVLEIPGKPSRTLSVDEVLSQPGFHTIDSGRHKDHPGITLSALLGSTPDSGEVLIQQCKEDPVRISAKDLKDQPDRWLFVKTGRNFLKLLEQEDGTDKPTRAAKLVTGVRLSE